MVLLSAGLWGCDNAGAPPSPLDPEGQAIQQVMLPANGTAPASDVEISPMAAGPTCAAPTIHRLVGPNGRARGRVELAHDATTLFVTFVLDAGWDPLVYTGVAVANAPGDLPFRPSGVPDVGAFPVSPPHPANTRQITWRIPRVLAAGEEVVLSAFARTGDDPAWMEGIPIAPRGNPFTAYVTFVADACGERPVDENGGTVTAPDAGASVEVPAGALSGPVAITVEPTTTDVANAIEGTAYDFGPDGTVFAEPVRLRIRFDPARLPAGVVREQLRLARVLGDRVEIVPGSGPLAGSDVVEGEVTHFSTWTLIWVPQVDLEAVGPVTFTPPAGVVGQRLDITAGIRNNSLTERADGVRLEFQVSALAIINLFEYPAGCVLVTPPDPLGGTIACTVDLAPGEEVQRTVAIQPTFFIGTSPVQVTARTQVPVGLWDPVFANNAVSGSTQVLAANAADVRLVLDPAVTLASKGGDLIEISGEVQYVLAPQETIEGARFLVDIQSDVIGALEVDLLDEGCAFALKEAATGALISCSGDVSAGEPARFRVGFRSLVAPQNLQVNVSAQPPFGLVDPTPSDNVAPTRTYRVEARDADLRMVYLISDPQVAMAGELVRFDLGAENEGPDALPFSTLRFEIAAGAVLVPGSGGLAPGCVDQSDLVPAAVQVDCTFGPISAGSPTPARIFFVQATTEGQSLEASAEYRVPRIAVDPDLTNNRLELLVAVPGTEVDLRTIVAADPTELRGFQTANVEVVIQNLNIPGSPTVNPSPATTTFISISGGAELTGTFPQGCSVPVLIAGELGFNCPVPGLPTAEGAQSHTIRFALRPTQVEQDLVVRAVTSEPEGVTDPRPENDQDEVRITVEPLSADLSITQFMDAPDPSPPGEVINYAVRVASAASSRDALPGARLDLVFEGDVEYALASLPCTSEFSVVGQRLTVACTLGSLAPGQEILASVFVRGNTPGQVLQARAEVRTLAGAEDTNPSNNTATQTTTITGVLAANRVYVGNTGSQTVTVLNADNGQASSTVTTSGGATRMTLRPGVEQVWAANETGTIRTVQIISTRTDAVTASLSLPVGARPRHVAFTPDGATAYVVDIGGNRVIEYDASTRALRAEIPMAIAPIAMAVSGDGRGWVAGVSGLLLEVDLATRQVRTLPLPQVGDLQDVILSDDGSALILLADNNQVQSRVLRVSTATGEVTGDVTVGGRLTAVVTEGDGRTAWVVDEQSSRIFEVAFPAAGSATATSRIQFAQVPWAMTWNRDRTAFLVTFRVAGQAGRFRRSDFVQEFLVPVGLQPMSIVLPE